MLSKYQDKFTMWHDKECINGEPRSNNAWIYTAYAKHLAPGSVDENSLQDRFDNCFRGYNPMLIDRKPGDAFPPLSKDEVIGMVSLGLIGNRLLENSHYNFCNIDSEFDRKLTFKSAFKAIKALWKIRKEHRNYYWQNEIVDTYPLSFKLMPWDIYYVKRMAGKEPNILETIAFYANMSFISAFGNKSVRMLLWLQLKDMKSSFEEEIPKKKWVRDYFGEEHDFYKRNW